MPLHNCNDIWLLKVLGGVQIDTLPNLEIPQLIGDKVAAAKQHTAAALSAAAAGNYTRAMAAAREARICAEVAGSHHTIVSQHSYPEQHKVALYLPLFAPLALPLLSAFCSEVKHALGYAKL